MEILLFFAVNGLLFYPYFENLPFPLSLFNLRFLFPLSFLFDKNLKQIQAPMGYWDYVTRLVESTMDNRTDIGNSAKADILRDELAKINTT